MMIHISQGGEVLGEYDTNTIRSMLSDGVIDETAYFWKEGMVDWRPIGEFQFSDANSEEAQLPVASKRKDKNTPSKTQIGFLQKRGISSEGLNKTDAANLIADLKQKEAIQREEDQKIRDAENAKRREEYLKVTPKQLAYLDYHGVRYKSNITKAEASALIEKYSERFRDSEWNSVKHILRPDLYEFYGGSDRAQKNYEAARAKLDQLKRAHASSIEDIEDAISDVSTAKEELADDKMERSDTVDCWADDFSNNIFPNDSSYDMDLPFSVFKRPSKSQIKEILLHFEDQYKFSSGLIKPEQFFFIYYKLFPDAVKKGKRPRFGISQITVAKTYKESKSGNTSSSSGCIGTLFKLILFIVLAILLISALGSMFSK